MSIRTVLLRLLVLVTALAGPGLLLPAPAHAQGYALIEDIGVTGVTADHLLGPGGQPRLQGTVFFNSTPTCGPTTEEPNPFVVEHQLYVLDSLTGDTVDILTLGTPTYGSCFTLNSGAGYTYDLVGAPLGEFAEVYRAARYDWYLVATVDDSAQAGPTPGNNQGYAYITRDTVDDVGIDDAFAELTGDYAGLGGGTTLSGWAVFSSSPFCNALIADFLPLPVTITLQATETTSGWIDTYALGAQVLSGCADINAGIGFSYPVSGLLQEFAVNHDGDEWDWRVVVQLDDAALGATAQGWNNQYSVSVDGRYRVKSGRLWFGAPGSAVYGTFTTLQEAPLGTCAPGEFAVDAASSFNWVASPSTGAIVGEPVTGGVYCTALGAITARGRDLIALGSLPAVAYGPAFDEIGVEYRVRLTSGGIELRGLEATLPFDTSLHRERILSQDGVGRPTPVAFTAPVPRGTRSLFVGTAPAGMPVFTALPTSDLALLTLSPKAMSVHLRIAGHPFTTYIKEGTALVFRPVDGSLEAVAQGIEYAHRRAYGVNDPRWTSPAPSNDAWLASAVVSPADPNVAIATGRIRLRFDTTGAIAGLTQRTHYPEAAHTSVPRAVSLGEDPRRLAAGRYNEGGLGERFRFTLETGCPGCGPGGMSPTYDLAVQEAGSAGDGAFAARVDGLVDPGFGPTVTLPTGPRAAFMRSGDAAKRGTFVVPGYSFPGTDVDLPAASIDVPGRLMAMNTLDADGTPIGGARLGSTEALRGNGFMAGLTVGPEIYRNAAGSPVEGRGESLAGTGMRIAFVGGAGRSDAELTSSFGTKYVVRAGGMTGVFNFTGLPVPMPKISGYDTSFSRFAFRLWANTLDKDSWIDGRVNVPAPGDFRIELASMGLECSGQVGSGNVVDDGTPEHLGAWNTPYDIRTANFVSAGAGGLCGDTPRTLRVGGNVVAAALTKALDVEANWASAGTASAVVITGDTTNELDRGNAGQDGFKVQLGKDATLGLGGADNGFFGFSGRVGVPFWNAVESKLRLQNRAAAGGPGGRPTPEPSIVAGKAAVLADATPNATIFNGRETDPNLNLSAKYEWVPGFGIDLPMFYAGREDGGAPRFLGKPETKSLLVMEIKQGVDFIKTENTKVSFGASANLDKLRLSNVVLNVDLNDPQSLAKADSWIQSITGTPNVISGVVSAVKSPGDFVVKYVGPGLQDLIHKGIDEALKGIEDELAKVADKLNFVQSMPGQVTDAVFGLAQAEIQKALSGLAGDIDAQVCGFYNGASASVEGAVVALVASGGATLDAAEAGGAAGIRAAVESAVTVLGPVHVAIHAASQAINTVKTVLGTATATLKTIHDKAIDGIGLARTAIDTVNGVITNVTQFPLLKCDGTSEKSNPILDQVKNLLAKVQQFVDAVASNTLKNIVGTLGRAIGLDTVLFEAAQASIGAAAKALLAKVTPAVGKINVQVCKLGAKFLAATATAKDLLDKAKKGLDTFQTAMNALMGPGVGGSPSLVKSVETFVNGQLTTTAKQLAEFDRQLGIFVDGLRSLAAGIRFDAPELADFKALKLHEPGTVQTYLRTAVAAAVPYGVDADFCQPSGRGPAAIVAQEINAVIGGFLGGLAKTVNDALTDVVKALPFPTAQSLTKMLREEIFNSGMVDELDNLVHSNLTMLAKSINDIGQDFFGHVNNVLKEATEKFNAMVQGLISQAQGVLDAIPVRAAKLDGYAIINARELERLHIGAEFTMGGDKDASGKENKDSRSTFSAALDITSWAANGKGKGCITDGGPTGAPAGTGILDASITARDLPISIGTGNLRLTLLMLGFTLEGATPVGIFGSIQTAGALIFGAFKLMNIGLEAGAGKYETYLGAKCAASFQGVDINAAFLAGKTCNGDVLKRIDPEAADFITLPGGIFQGAYARGSASIPIITGGCALTIGAGVDVGFWLLSAAGITNVGGILGGSAFGEAICLVGLRGGVKLMAESFDGDFRFRGTGYGVGGIGFDCDPETWTTIPRSREDDWCMTGDAEMTAEYRGSFAIKNVSVDGVF